MGEEKLEAPEGKSEFSVGSVSLVDAKTANKAVR